MLPLPLLKTLVSSSGVFSASSFTLMESPGQSPLPPRCHWPSPWVYPASSKAHEKSLCSTSLEPSPILLLFVHKHSHWTALLPNPYETLSDLTWMSLPVPLLPLLYNLACDLLPSSSSFLHSIALSDLTFLLSSSAHGLSPELVHSQTTIEPVTCGAIVSGQGAELLRSDKRSVTEWWRARVGKEHSGSKWQESPSKQKNPNPVLTIWVSNHTGCELLCWSWDSHCIFVSALLEASYDWCFHQCRQGEGHPLVKLPIC